MKQKLGLLCTLVRSPDLLLLDEPTAGVDPLSRRELWEILQEQARKARLSVLCATAYMSEAALCQKVILLDRGRILAAGTPDEVRRPLRNIFGTSPTSAAQAQFEDTASGEKRSAIIEVRDLVKKFGDFTAVNNTSFQVYKGEVFGLLGPNGAGKTTTFRMLCGLLPATSGKLRVAGVDLARARTEARAQIGYVAQKFSLYQNLTALENLRFFGGIYGLRPKALAARIEAVLAEFDLKERKNDRAGDLPGGYKQRLAMAAALLHEPPLLFLDEPTSGIDPRARSLFWQKIDALSKRGTTVIITTHFME
ncbi:MAG: ATP-binding cassette domain-containing protein, partial [Selenomonas sp.]